MSRASTLARGRAAAVEGMTATVRVLYRTGRVTQDEASGAEVPEYGTRFESVARFQANQLASSDIDVGGRRAVLETIQVQLPITAGVASVDDVVLCLTNPNDPRLVGRRFIVGAPMNKSDATVTRLNVKEEA